MTTITSPTAPSPASSSWEPLGETFYKKTDIYSMQWSIQDLSDFIVVGARWGGPVAMMRDDRKPVILGRQSIGKPKISIYSSAGGLLQTISWESSTRIIALGWTLSESLVVLTQDGTYRLYSLSTTSSTPIYTQHSLGSEAQESGVHEAKIYEDGMVVLLGNLTFIEVKGWQNTTSIEEEEGQSGSVGGRLVVLANPGLTELPQCWCVLSPELSYTRGVEVIICSGPTVLKLDEIEVQDQRITRGPFLSITPSPNGRFFSLLSQPPNSAPQLWVASSDFTRSLSEFDLGSEGERGPPTQVVWCGNNTVVVAWDRTVVMVGPFGETLKYFYSDPVYLVGEIDGTRIISNDACEFLQIVPQSSQDVFRPGSASPSAILFEAAELFEKRSPKADEYIRNIRADLTNAVDTCIDAAGREFEVYWQKKLLKAATFGKTFLELYNPNDFVQMSQTLRVLNAARYYEIGIPLTYDQYQAHPPSQLIARLTSRSQHLLSLRISNFLHLSPAPILKHWAQAKITAAKGLNNDEETCRIIVTKLKESMTMTMGAGSGSDGTGEVSCADVARTAWSTGQNGLATRLLNFEPRASKQVALLLNMKEDDLALVKAIESGDPDLVYNVLLHLRRNHSLRDFFRFVDNKPDATALLQIYSRENDVELLRDFFYQDDRRKESACLALEESLSIGDFGEKVAKIRLAAKAFAEDKDCNFEAKIIEEQVKLLVFQQSLEQESIGKVFVGLSVIETIRACIVTGLPKKADKIRADFKVPDKQFWYIKMKALIEIRDWEGLETFAKSKRSPIGYIPFINTLIAAGAQRQAVTVINRCDAKDRVDMYLKCGEWVLAGQEAVRRSDRTTLIDLKNRAPNSIVAAQLDQLFEELQNNA